MDSISATRWKPAANMALMLAQEQRRTVQLHCSVPTEAPPVLYPAQPIVAQPIVATDPTASQPPHTAACFPGAGTRSWTLVGSRPSNPRILTAEQPVFDRDSLWRPDSSAGIGQHVLEQPTEPVGIALAQFEPLARGIAFLHQTEQNGTGLQCVGTLMIKHELLGHGVAPSRQIVRRAKAHQV